MAKNGSQAKVTLDLTVKARSDGTFDVCVGGLHAGQIERDAEWVRGWDWAAPPSEALDARARESIENTLDALTGELDDDREREAESDDVVPVEGPYTVPTLGERETGSRIKTLVEVFDAAGRAKQ